MSGSGCNNTLVGSVRGVLDPGAGSPDDTIDLQGGLDLLIDTAGGSSTGSAWARDIFAGDLAEAVGGAFAVTTRGANAGPISHG